MKAKKAKKVKKAHKKDKGGLSTSEEDGMDLKEELFPLSHYIDDEEELIRQMFSTIKGAKLQALMPKSIQSLPLMELKRLCLHELRGMSKKRILCVISGEVMEGSSEEDEGDSHSESEDDQKAESTANEGGKTRPSPSDATDNLTLIKGHQDSPHKESEIHELEMRARLIKTILEKQSEEDKKRKTQSYVDIVIKKEPGTENILPVGGTAKMSSYSEENEIRGIQEDIRIKAESAEYSRKELQTIPVKSVKREISWDRGSSHRKSRKSVKRRHSYDSGSHSWKRHSRYKNRHDDTSVRQRKKITKKEFEERMKKAKMNRSYRKRNNSEDEAKERGVSDTQNDIDSKDKIDESNDTNKNETKDATSSNGNNIVEGTVEESEKEEGEIGSSDEAEEGACSPTSCSSENSYSDSSHRGRRRRQRSRSYSSSCSRNCSSSCSSNSHSRSRSSSRETRKRKGHAFRSSRSRSPHLPSKPSKQGVKSASNYRCGIVRLPGAGEFVDFQSGNTVNPQSRLQENWKQKSGIELVDSEEDFDDSQNSDNVHTLKSKSERSAISFSIQKKTVPTIQPNYDLQDDIAIIEAKGSSADPIVVGSLDDKRSQIIISSDSDDEKMNVSTRSQKVNNEDHQHDQDDYDLLQQLDQTIVDVPIDPPSPVEDAEIPSESQVQSVTEDKSTPREITEGRLPLTVCDNSALSNACKTDSVIVISENYIVAKEKEISEASNSIPQCFDDQSHSEFTEAASRTSDLLTETEMTNKQRTGNNEECVADSVKGTVRDNCIKFKCSEETDQLMAVDSDQFVSTDAATVNISNHKSKDVESADVEINKDYSGIGRSDEASNGICRNRSVERSIADVMGETDSSQAVRSTDADDKDVIEVVGYTPAEKVKVVTLSGSETSDSELEFEV